MVSGKLGITGYKRCLMFMSVTKKEREEIRFCLKVSIWFLIGEKWTSGTQHSTEWISYFDDHLEMLIFLRPFFFLCVPWAGGGREKGRLSKDNISNSQVVWVVYMSDCCHGHSKTIYVQMSRSSVCSAWAINACTHVLLQGPSDDSTETRESGFVR